ncbi:MAG: hypothetical protein HYR70_04685 [Chloroflexi bacterium]|nr:hypothetical protein [Chloroflexota bacterium]MBI3340473.1 hypothetical protein [Chloroflexota bacterium]
MNNKLFEALENCLQALEQGQNIDAVLAQYPDLAQQLRPMLEASLQARTMSGEAVPGDVQRRARARLLQRAAEMREAKRAPRRRMIPAFSRLAITLGLAGALFLSSTGLVSASSGALPGDQLYPVKRTWEDVRLLFVFSPQGRDILESQYEQERLDEIDELLVIRRNAPISFSGLVTKQQDGQWLVSGIPVLVTTETRLPATAISNGAPVTVIGMTHADGVVDAQEIRLLAPGVALPPLEPSGDNDQNGENDNENHNFNAAPTPVVISTPDTSASASQEPQKQELNSYEFSGVVESMQGNIWSINGQIVTVDQAQIDGAVKVGVLVKFEGYYDSNGKFIVTKIEVKSGDGDSSKGDQSGSGSSGDNQNMSSNTNDQANANDNTNINSNDNGNENEH